jgi:pyruvate/2-oxoglutarate dehydrogenase complex dihydrolipoamide acyltransferase (E2) component
MSVDIEVHDVVVELGESSSEGELLEPRFVVGDVVEKNQVLVEVDAGKVTIELVAPVSGRVLEIARGGPVARGAVVVRIEEIADPHELATLREAAKVRRELEAQAVAARAAKTAARAPIHRGALVKTLVVKIGEVARDVDVRPIDARIGALTKVRHAEAAAHAVRVARSLAVAPDLMPSRPMGIAYLSVRAGIETRTNLSVAIHHDEGEVTELDQDLDPIDAVIVRFHDTATRVGLPIVTASLNTILIGAPRVVPCLDAEGAVTLAPRAEVTLKLMREPSLSQRVLAALVEQLERA